MAQTGSRRGAASSTSLLLAVVAFIAMAGLIYWLNKTAVPTQTENPSADTMATNTPPATDVPLVSIAQINQDPSGYVGLQIEIRNEGVNSLLGSAGFWIGPSDKPFLVHMDSAAAASAPQVATGDTVTVRGRIEAMSDSVLDAWQKAGSIKGQGDRAVASFAEHYLDASQVEPGKAQPAQPAGGSPGAAASQGGGQSGSQSSGAD